MPALPLTVAGVIVTTQAALVIALGMGNLTAATAAAPVSAAPTTSPMVTVPPQLDRAAVDPAQWRAATRGQDRSDGGPAYALPVDEGTEVSGEFGAPGPSWPGGHAGIDFNGETGDPIYAATNGRVVYAEFNYGGYGNLVMIERNDGVQTRYAHLDRILVKSGERVRAGELIGRMGSTGDSSGSHLHFEVRVGPVPTPVEPRSLWSGKKPGIPAKPPAWACAKYGC